MGNVEDAAKGVGHAVGHAKAAVVERHARHAGSKKHVLPRFHVVTVSVAAKQVPENVLDGMHRIEIGKGVGAGGDKGLQGVGENIHAGGCGHRRGHRARESRIKNRHIGYDEGIDERNFKLCFGVGDHSNGGHFRAGAAGGGNHHKTGFAAGDVGLAGEVHHRLGGVDGRASSKGNHQIGPVGQKLHGALLDRLKGGVGLDFTKEGVADPGAFQAADDAVCKPDLHHKGVGDDKGVIAFQGLQIVDGVVAVADFGVSAELSHRLFLLSRGVSYQSPRLHILHRNYSAFLTCCSQSAG